MLKRGLFIGLATALALVVLLLTMLAEPARKPDSDSGKATAPDTPSKIDTGILATVDPNQRAIRNAEKYHFTRVNKHNQLIQGGGDDLVPKPQGVSDVTHPWARIHLTPERVLEIRADHGTFVAPDRQPRNGDFQGRVVLTLFEGPSERPVILTPHSPDITLRVFLEDAKFDLELGHIESQSKVHLTTPRIDFRGKELNLNYNEVQKRIEHLEVAQGELLRIKQANDATSSANGPNAPPTSQPSRGRKNGTTRPARPGHPAATRPAIPALPQYYRARLTDQVRIQGRDLESEADELITIFALNQHGGGEPTPGPRSAPNPSSTPKSVNGKTAAATTTTQAAEPWLAPDETMAPPGVNDLTITWIGPMIVDPEDHPPKDLSGPDDSMMELTGRPMHATIFKKDAPPGATGASVVEENITAAHFDYLSKSGRIRLTGSEQFPMLLDSVALGGQLRGPSLVLDQAANIGWVDGGGTLVSTDQPAPATTQPAGGRMPPGMKITWHDRLDLAFYPQLAHTQHNTAGAGVPGAGTEPVRLRALKTAIFHGRVTIQHPQFQLAGDRVAMALTDPAEGKPTLNLIDATGHASIASLEGPAENRVTIHSDQLAIGLSHEANGSVQPSRLLAQDHVHAELPNRSLDSQYLDVTLAPATQAPAGATTPASLGPANAHVAIKTLDARQGVRVRTNDPMTMTADRLLADARTDEVELSGLLGQPAVVERADGTLISRHIFLNQKAQTVRVDEPGLFAFPAKSSSQPDQPAAPPPAPDMNLLLRLAARAASQPHPHAAAPDSSPLAGAPRADVSPVAEDAAAAPDRWTIITWRDLMTFDNLQGLGQFRGAVRVRSRTGSQTNRLRCEDLRLEFSAATPPNPNAPPPVSPAPAAGQFSQGSRSLHTMDIRDGAHFEGETWEDQPGTGGSGGGGENLLRRITLEGKQFIFTEPAEDLVVPGAGRMLIEDYRPEANPETQPAQTQPDGSPIKFSGRGQTLLLWSGKLTINTARNDMLAEDNVRMIHEPFGVEDKTQLFCERLKTELEPAGNGNAGGLSALGNGQSQPPLKAIQADRSVRVLARGRTIVSDHLRYTAASQTVVLTGDPDHLVEMTAPDDASTYTAEEFDWDLAKDRIIILHPGPGRMPLK